MGVSHTGESRVRPLDLYETAGESPVRPLDLYDIAGLIA
jgi:hypothetical protein